MTTLGDADGLGTINPQLIADIFPERIIDFLFDLFAPSLGSRGLSSLGHQQK